MYKKLLALAFAALFSASASADIVKYEFKDVYASDGSTLNGWMYQSSVDHSILYFDMALRGPTLWMGFDSIHYSGAQSLHNYFSGAGPTSFTAIANNGDYEGKLVLNFLPGTGVRILVRGHETQTPREPWYGVTKYSERAIQYGTVTSSIVTDPATIALIMQYPKSGVPTVSQAAPIHVPEPGSLLLLTLGGLTALTAAQRRRTAGTKA